MGKGVSKIRITLELPLEPQALLSMRVDDFKGKGVDITSECVNGKLIYTVESTPEKLPLARSITNEILRLAKMLESAKNHLENSSGGPAGI